MARERQKYAERVGTVVDGKWRVDSLLGVGTTSALYVATHRNGHRAALKVIHRALCGDRVACERFLREAYIANAIKHRAIVPVQDDGMTDDGCAFLILDLLEGTTLEDMRKEAGGKLPLDIVAPVAEQLMSALTAVHEANVVHRDLKPQNVFITTSAELKLLDFAAARFPEPEGQKGHPVSVAGMVVGTPAFMAPEQARGARDQIDARSDVWALGALLFSVLSGSTVHVESEGQQGLLAAGSRPARSLADVAPELDARIVLVIDRALEFEKELRWEDVRAMRVALRRAFADAGVNATEMPRARAATPVPAGPRPPTMPPAAMHAGHVGRDVDGASEERATEEAAPSSPRPIHTPLDAVTPLRRSSWPGNVASDDTTSDDVFSRRSSPSRRKNGTFVWAAAAAGVIALVAIIAVATSDGPTSSSRIPESTTATVETPLPLPGSTLPSITIGDDPNAPSPGAGGAGAGGHPAPKSAPPRPVMSGAAVGASASPSGSVGGASGSGSAGSTGPAPTGSEALPTPTGAAEPAASALPPSPSAPSPSAPSSAAPPPTKAAEPTSPASAEEVAAPSSP